MNLNKMNCFDIRIQNNDDKNLNEKCTQTTRYLVVIYIVILSFKTKLLLLSVLRISLNFY